MPRNRTARSAVLGLPVRRPAPRPLHLPHQQRPPAPASCSGVLVLLSLALITVSFREEQDGPLHDAQGAVASVLQPLEVAVERVARPFRDAYGWTTSLLDARSENERLRAENEQLQQQVIQNESALQRERRRSRDLLDYQRSPGVPGRLRRRRRRGDRAPVERLRADDRRLGRLRRRRRGRRAGRHRRRARRHGDERDRRRGARAPAHRRVERRLRARPAHERRRDRPARPVGRLARPRPRLEEGGRAASATRSSPPAGAPAGSPPSIRRGSRSAASRSSASSTPTSTSRCRSSRTSTSRRSTRCSCSSRAGPRRRLP